MLDTILHAAEHFMQQQLALQESAVSSPKAVRTLLAYIDITSEYNERYRVYVGCDDALIDLIVELFLGETQSDEATRTDMALETANLVVGSAKVVAEERAGVAFGIGIPHFVGHGPLDVDCDAIRGIESGAYTMIIGIKGM